VGKGLVRALICYLDTQAAIWLAEANTQKLSHKALSYIEKAEIRISPMVVLEFGYLYEINRTVLTPQQIVYKLSAELQSAVCDYPFPIIAEIAIGETWTRDPFDRLIVSHAKANGRAGLVTKDELIARHYPNTIW
jgi:PIN domain nuclease of toxin-antitoxin system